MKKLAAKDKEASEALGTSNGFLADGSSLPGDPFLAGKNNDLVTASSISISNLTDTVQLKKTFGLFNGVALIMGTIIGSGIFVSPKGVLRESGSVGMALIVWTLCGVICLMGAHCFAELGTCIRKSGGMYAYIFEAFGPLPAFLYLWVFLIVIGPAANAVISLTFAHYVVYPFFPECPSPDAAVRLLAAVAVCLLTFVNCASVRWASRIQDFFTIVKTLALLIIIITGIVVLCMGKTENLTNAFDSSTDYEAGKVALAFYSGMFSYSGWYALNFLTEELKNPYRNLPLAIWISMPLVTVIYVLANLAYFTVLPSSEILSSDAVAVSFAMKMFGFMSCLMPIFVAFSTFGSLNGCILTCSRVFFVGAREGQLPEFLALININKFTPVPAILFETLVTLLMLSTSDVFLLINCVSFIEATAFGACVAALLYLRKKQPHLERPIKVHLALPIIFLIICGVLLVIPLVTTPSETLFGVTILLTGIPVYLVGVVWKNKPAFYKRLAGKTMLFCEKLMFALPQDGKVE